MKDLVIKRLLRRSGKNGKGVHVVYFRFQLMWDRVRYPYFECSTKIVVPGPKKWDYDAQEVKGTTDATKRLNQSIKDKETPVDTFWEKYKVNTESGFNYPQFKKLINALVGGKHVQKYDAKNEVFIPMLFDRHIASGKPTGGEYTKHRKSRYTLMKKHVVDYCKLKFDTDEIPLDRLGKPFYNDFRKYLSDQLPGNQSTLQGYMKVFEAAVNSEWERNDYKSKNPLKGCKTSPGKSTRVALSLPELNRIKALTSSSLGPGELLARDIFLFGAYTGISYCDIKSLTTKNIQSLEGESYLVKDREKNINHANSNFFSVPINENIQTLLATFGKHPKIAGTGKLVPITSNADYNRQLKLIKVYAGIEKPLSSHVARHTMACLFLEGGGSIEVLMKILGHSRITQTQQYGKITPSRVSKEVRQVMEYFSKKEAGAS